jgi:uncharacterized protein YjiS (DUF1127 family)
MYLHREFIVANRVPASIHPVGRLDYHDLEAAVLRGRKIRAEAAGRLIDAVSGAVARGFHAIFGPFLRWHRELAALRELRQLDPHMLADIGLAPGQLKYAARHGREDVTLATPVPLAAQTAANDGGQGEVHEAA